MKEIGLKIKKAQTKIVFTIGILGILSISILCSSTTNAQNSWWNDQFPGGYPIKHNFDPDNPASKSANKFMDDPWYRSDDSYVFDGMTLQAVTEKSAETNAARFELTDIGINLYQKVKNGGFPERLLGRIRLGPFGEDFRWKLRKTTQRSAFFTGTIGSPPQYLVELRINGDSLLMVRTIDELNLAFGANKNGRFGLGRFDPIYSPPQSNGNVTLLDDLGGVSLHPIGGILNDKAEYDQTLRAWIFRLAAGQNFWLSVFPSRPFEWDRASQRIFWKYACYPNTPYQDTSLIDSEFFSNIQDNNNNILLLQSEASLWNNWNLEFIPKKNLQPSFEDYITQANESNMKVVVYASPYYFTKNHPRKKFRNYEWDPCAGQPIAIAFGENSQEYLNAVSKLLKSYPSLGGIYFDEIYPFNLPESYAVILEVRKWLGPDKTIIYHNTLQTVFTPWIDSNNFYENFWDAAKNSIACPTIDAYTDFTLTGEIPGDQHVLVDQNYLRFRLSNYNISNSIGLLGNYFVYADKKTSSLEFAPNLDTGGSWLFESIAWDALRVNARIPCREILHDTRRSETSQFWDSLISYWSRVPSNYKEYLFLLNSGVFFSHVFGRAIGGVHFVGDFDGNGRDDFAYFEPQTIDANGKIVYGSDSMYIRASRTDKWNPIKGWQNADFGHSSGQFLIGDFNGDGWDDFSFFEPGDNSMHIRLNTPEGFVAGIGWDSNHFGHSTGSFFIGDFNRDGLEDFAFFEPADNSMHIALNRGTYYEPGTGWVSNAFGHKDGTFFVGDFDGDGRDDFAFFEPADNTMHIALNRGTYYEPGTGWASNAFGHKDGRFFVGDFDGDGRDDFAFFEPADNTMHIALNRGPYYELGTGWASNAFGHKDGKFSTGDFNGDGKSDFAFFEPGPASYSTPYYTRIFTRLTLDQINDLVTFAPLKPDEPTPDTTGCQDGFMWRFSFDARLRSVKDLLDLTVKVHSIKKPNLLQNADFGPGGKDAILTVPKIDDYTDGILSPEEYVDVPFTVCLENLKPFRFFVNVLGVAAD